jgi:large subunit ribosomal protein L13
MKYTIDAQNKKIGRIASEAAAYLMGKSSTSFAKNTISDVKVEIINTEKADVSTKKKITDSYTTYTGFRGGLNKEKLGDLMVRKGMIEVLKRAVYNMIPDNKLRTGRLKNLTIKK